MYNNNVYFSAIINKLKENTKITLAEKSTH